MIDAKDRHILSLLSTNSRQPISHIAKLVRLSKTAVLHRIQQLERENIITNYLTIINFRKLGYEVVRINVKFFNCLPEQEEDIISSLVKKREVLYVQEVKGNYDMSFGLKVKNLDDFFSLWDSFIRKYKSVIKSYHFSFYKRIVYYARNYLSSLSSSYVTLEKDISVQPKDIQILELIAKNSRISVVSMAKKLSLPVTTVSRRLKLLEKSNIIQAYTVSINLNKINYHYFKLQIYLSDFNSIGKIKSFAERNNYITYLIETVGSADVELFFEVPSLADLQEEIKNLRILVPEIIEWNYVILQDYHKFQYF